MFLQFGNRLFGDLQFEVKYSLVFLLVGAKSDLENNINIIIVIIINNNNNYGFDLGGLGPLVDLLDVVVGDLVEFGESGLEVGFYEV